MCAQCEEHKNYLHVQKKDDSKTIYHWTHIHTHTHTHTHTEKNNRFDTGLMTFVRRLQKGYTTQNTVVNKCYLVTPSNKSLWAGTENNHWEQNALQTERVG